MPQRQRREINKILVLLDWENLSISADDIPPEKFSLTAGFHRLAQQFRDVGEVTNVFLFAPLPSLATHAEIFYRQGFISVLCPKIHSKSGEEQDTTDGIIITFGQRIIGHMPDLTHLCIGSGDRDFVPLAREAIRRGLRIIIVAGSCQSLAPELSELADIHPMSKKRMVYLFSPTKT